MRHLGVQIVQLPETASHSTIAIRTQSPGFAANRIDRSSANSVLRHLISSGETASLKSCGENRSPRTIASTRLIGLFAPPPWGNSLLAVADISTVAAVRHPTRKTPGRTKKLSRSSGPSMRRHRFDYNRKRARRTSSNDSAIWSHAVRPSLIAEVVAGFAVGWRRLPVLAIVDVGVLLVVLDFDRTTERAVELGVAGSMAALTGSAAFLPWTGGLVATTGVDPAVIARRAVLGALAASGIAGGTR